MSPYGVFLHAIMHVQPVSALIFILRVTNHTHRPAESRQHRSLAPCFSNSGYTTSLEFSFVMTCTWHILLDSLPWTLRSQLCSELLRTLSTLLASKLIHLRLEKPIVLEHLFDLCSCMVYVFENVNKCCACMQHLVIKHVLHSQCPFLL
ncbi:hypothetical protein K491DRAFT_89516 [Lophiostoma macrostomum CBS 122681]|uniref:Uncharacterized protein n=1 Tax=Lophiostoma macrostomum CBS 122681 TaxID=1314788 RepID=A0A6A6SZ51_9PLEO|nr:hypothetical protein K491DRAFT_89516 [Lophiostoma macrostomum CBS 122681]